MKDTVEMIVKAAISAPSADNTQPLRYIVKDSQVMIEAVKTADDNVFKAMSHASLLALGAALENMRQIADQLSVNLDITTNFENFSGQYAVVEIGSPQGKPVDPTSHPVFQRHTNRMAYKSNPVPQKFSKEINNIGDNVSKVAVYTKNQDIEKIGEMIKKSSECRFRNEQIHRWFGDTLRFTPDQVDSGDGLDVATFDLPPGGRYLLRFIREWSRMNALNKIGGYKLLSSIEAQTIVKAPMLIAISGGETPQAICDAGSRMEQIWILLNSYGLAVQPFYVLSDLIQRCKEPDFPSHLNTSAQEIISMKEVFFGEDVLHMVLRVGYPTKSVVKSKRLSWSSLVVNEDA